MEKEKDQMLKRQEVKWLLPPEGWHKANFDGASKGNIGPSGCGGIIRNEFGEGVTNFSLLLGTQTNHFAEARATCHVVKLAFEVGITKLWLEGDSNNIIICINCKTHPSWSIANLIEETHDTLAKFDSVHVTYLFREENPVANWFANKGVGSNKLMTWKLGKNILVEAKSPIDLEKIQGCMVEI